MYPVNILKDMATEVSVRWEGLRSLLVSERSEQDTLNGVQVAILISECSRTLYVGFTGTFQILIQKSMGSCFVFL